MAKNSADLLIAQYLLVKGWANPLQISECMRIAQKNTHSSLGEALIQKGYIRPEQLASAEEIVKKRSKDDDESTGIDETNPKEKDKMPSNLSDNSKISSIPVGQSVSGVSGWQSAIPGGKPTSPDIQEPTPLPRPSFEAKQASNPPVPVSKADFLPLRPTPHAPISVVKADFAQNSLPVSKADFLPLRPTPHAPISVVKADFAQNSLPVCPVPSPKDMPVPSVSGAGENIPIPVPIGDDTPVSVVPVGDDTPPSVPADEDTPLPASFIKSPQEIAKSPATGNTPPPIPIDEDTPLPASFIKDAKELEKNSVVEKLPRIREEGTPKEFGPYKILSELGRGGMGVVYKVKHPELDFPLAMKVLLQTSSSKDDTGENALRFFREIELASKLRHPNIIGIHDVGSYNHCPYFTMDYIEGQTLDKILRKKAPLPERTALEIIEKVASGLASAHKAKIVHRDLKPANIIIDQQNRVYLMDFGIATCREKMFKKLTQTGTIIGTPDYMSPEQATGKVRLISYQSDVYSLGATLYHALTGRTPFSGDSPIDIITNVIERDPIPVRQINANVSRQAEAVVMKALSKDIADRYPNAGAFMLDIRAILAGGKTVARPESVPKVIFRWLKRNALVLICFFITCVAILTTIFLVLKAMK